MATRARWLTWAGLVAAVLAPAAAQGMRPSWECLPDGTVAMVRLPQPAEFMTTLRGSTRFGAVALGQERLEGLWRLLIEQSGKAGDDAASRSFAAWEESLAKHGLAMSDLTAVLSGDLGAGLVVRRRDGLPPLMMLVAWAEPGEEVAGRLLAAVKQWLGEAADGEGPTPRRIDLELAGHEVVSAVLPVMRVELEDMDLDDLATEGADEKSDLPERLERLQERLRDAKLVQTGETHAFHAVQGGRFLYARSLPAAPSATADGEGRAFAETSGREEARACFEAFLAAHDRDDEAALARVLREPALAASAPAGKPLLEMVFVPRVAMTAAGGERGEEERRLARLGVDDVGGVACWQTFDAGRWRSTVAVSLPSPRHGLLAMLDQPCDACEVPPFVTREVVDFTQVSLDLGKVYGGVREALLAEADSERVGNMFDVADVQATAWLGADVATFLSRLGSRHWFLAFPPRIGAAMAEARAAAAAGRTGMELPGADSMAIVWQVADEESLVKLLGRLATLVGGQLEEEQGFRGLRLPGGAAAYAGRNHLVMAVGTGTLEKVLAAIRNPPAGDVSWQQSDALRRVRQLVELAPARMFGVSDASRTGGTLGTLRELLAALEPDDVAEGGREALAAAQKLLPTAAEMQGMFGVGGSVLRVTEDGLVLQSAWEMPAP